MQFEHQTIENTALPATWLPSQRGKNSLFRRLGGQLRRPARIEEKIVRKVVGAFLGARYCRV